MSVLIVTPPVVLVTFAEAKAAARVLRDDEDTAVTNLLTVAQTALEPPSWVGAALGEQTIELRTDGFFPWCDAVRLPYGPAQSIVSVKYDDENGEEQTLPPEAYDLADAGTRRARAVWREGADRPATRSAWNSVRLQYKAGLPKADPRLAPARHAIILSAVQLRSLSASDLALRTIDVPGVASRTYTVSDAAERLIKNAVETLMAPYRNYSV